MSQLHDHVMNQFAVGHVTFLTCLRLVMLELDGHAKSLGNNMLRCRALETRKQTFGGVLPSFLSILYLLSQSSLADQVLPCPKSEL